MSEETNTDVQDMMRESQEFAQNMAAVSETSAEIWKKMFEAQAAKADHVARPDPLNTLPTFTHFAQVLANHPQELATATIAWWQAQSELWQSAVSRWMGEPTEPLVEPGRGDKRFKHEQWSENVLFDYLKQSYLLTSSYMQGAAHDIGDLDPQERKKVEFYTRTFVEAMSPSNFFALNPEVLEATVSQKGENLVRGLKMMLADLERGKGDLLIRQTDMDAFEVGRDMAVTPGAVIFENNVLQLIQYAPKTEQVYAKPLLFIPPWINKYYVLDLNEKKSMMKWLVEQGYTVFIISWVNPDERQAGETWESYMGAISDAIDVALKETGQKKINLASYCIGGTMVGSFLAHAGKTGDTRIASATLFTAQLDFADAGELQVFVDDHTIDAVDDEMEKGYLPAQKMASAFNMLRSADLIWGYIINNYMLGKDPFPFDLLYWNADSTAMPARVHHFYLETFYRDNAFVKGALPIHGNMLGLGDIKAPVYHVATKEDHIAPAHSVYRGARMMENADVRFVVGGSGHIAGVVNPPAAGKYQYWVNEDLTPETLPEWMEKTEEKPGSWWVDWDQWLAGHSGRKVKPRVPGAKAGVLEDAPGSFVKLRFDKR
ncbi:PHA/PHB synthase family protein [Pontivivens insulae]|uniref:Poly(3-hydroxyalkanoate) polymerase subunit PhaC n=1 Tax=Pontivivens insulae TaxID=1639689 RepID=A0A2R8ADY8_9RHOB|nr:class I poly(R)-hydroxyalkanoic acid synthase [Pontivivens insulae]RED14205.1 polyhydroxyalkanoate synthase [Pontivivens insulae]SPF30280.1 Poly(3-hydroxyalkanoate) polymerase subunit PhaC [Pontivivens insulae]